MIWADILNFKGWTWNIFLDYSRLPAVSQPTFMGFSGDWRAIANTHLSDVESIGSKAKQR